MKKKIFIISAVLLSTMSTLQAQINDNREKLELGVKVGLNVSNVWDEEGNDFVADPKTGLALGGFVRIPIGKFIGFQPELLISQKGFKGSGTLVGFPYSFTRTTTYLDVPLLLQIKPIPLVTLLTGPQFSYLLKEKNVYTFGNNSAVQEQEFQNEDIRKNMMGFIIGFDINYNAFVFSSRAGWDFQTNNQNGSSTTPRYKNQWLQFTVGYKI